MALAFPDSWALGLRLEVDASRFSLVGREYEQAILRDESSAIVMPKAAQVGGTMAMILKSCHSIVQRGWSVLYLLPLKAGSVQFVQGRIDPIIDSNKSLAAQFSRTDNRVQKVTAKGVKWYIRGTNIQTELREAPADILVIDEVDVANQENLPDAYARLDGSEIQRVYELSTPTIDGHGVYGEDGWQSSDQMEWWVSCPHCGSKQIIDWEANVLPNIGDVLGECLEACRCQHCHKPLTDAERAAMNATGQWVPSNPGADVRGYRLSQFNSPTKTLADPRFGILVNWFAGQTDSLKLKAFYNLSLALPYAAAGDKFTTDLLDRCRRDFTLGGVPEGPLFIGIDQGQEVLHVTMWTFVRENFKLWQARTITAQGDRSKWQMLEEEVLRRQSSWIAVCDAHPDKEDCEALSKKYSGRFWMGFEKDRPDQKETAAYQPAKYGEAAKVNIARTEAFDSYIKRFIDGKALIPKDARELGEYMPGRPYNGFYHHHLQMTRVQQADASDRLVARWVNGKVVVDKIKQRGKSGNRPDHWHHSGMFALVATMQDVPLVIEPEVGEMFARAGGLIGAAT